MSSPLLILCLAAIPSPYRRLSEPPQPTPDPNIECLGYASVLGIACPELQDVNESRYVRTLCGGCAPLWYRVMEKCGNGQFPPGLCTGDCVALLQNSSKMMSVAEACDSPACQVCWNGGGECPDECIDCVAYAHCYDPDTDGFRPLPETDSHNFLTTCDDFTMAHQSAGCCDPSHVPTTTLYVKL